MRLRGKGITRKAKEPGDLYVKFIVHVPTVDDPEVAKAIEVLAPTNRRSADQTDLLIHTGEEPHRRLCAVRRERGGVAEGTKQGLGVIVIPTPGDVDSASIAAEPPLKGPGPRSRGRGRRERDPSDRASSADES